MELSIYLARLLGVYMLVVSVLFVLRGKALESVLEEFFAQRALVFLSGLIALSVGIAMVIGHSVWEPSWRGAVTLIGYLSLAKGIARTGFPDKIPQAAVGMIRSSGKWVWIGVIAALGAWLTWAGFTAGSPGS